MQNALKSIMQEENTIIIISMLLERITCFLDQSFVLLYTGLTAATFLSVLSPFFRHLSVHGKTRSFVVTAVDDIQQSRQATVTRIIESEILSFAQNWDIQKSYFIHFYVIGVLSLSLGLYLSHQRAPTILVILLSTHLLRRTYECICVHQWTPSSKMHVMGYLAGAAHYLWFPFSFVQVPCGAKSSSTRDEDAHLLWLSYFVFLVGIWAQYQQHRHHVLLAQLRKTKDTNNTYYAKEAPKYRIPIGGWFRWISCPHYLAEIVLYCCFAILVHFDGDRDHVLRMRLVLLFVVLNLSVTATRVHRWYYEHCPGYNELQRRALIPFLF